MLVIISIESQAREWESQTLLGAELAARGCRVILSYDQFLIRNIIEIARQTNEEICLVDKSASISCIPKRIGPLLQATSRASAVILFQEGWLADKVPTPIIQMYTAADADKYIRRFFVFGKDQASKFSQVASAGIIHKTRVTGSPRFDLSTTYSEVFKSRASALKELYGPYTLVTDPFVSSPGSGRAVDLLCPPSWLTDSRNSGKIETYAEQYFERVSVSSKEFFKRFSKLVSSNPNQKFVYRAHPGSTEQHLRQALIGETNVRIDKSFSADAWIASAHRICTHVCTTGLQAILWGKNPFIFDIEHPYLESKFGSILTKFSGLEHANSDAKEALNDVVSNVGFAHKIVANEIISLSIEDSLNPATRRPIFQILSHLWDRDLSAYGRPQFWKWGGFEELSGTIVECHVKKNFKPVQISVVSNCLMILEPSL